MADPAVTPSAVASAASALTAGVGAVPVFLIMGVDGANLGWGLMGVVIAQCVLPQPPQAWGKVMGMAVGSTLFAGLAAPFAGAGLHAMAPSSWEWLVSIPGESFRAAAAAVCGGFAQPLMLGIAGKIRRAVPPPQETKPEQ